MRDSRPSASKARLFKWHLKYGSYRRESLSLQPRRIIRLASRAVARLGVAHPSNFRQFFFENCLRKDGVSALQAWDNNRKDAI